MIGLLYSLVGRGMALKLTWYKYTKKLPPNYVIN